MIAAREYFRNGAALPKLRTRILRIFKKSLREAFLLGRSLFAHDAGQKANARVEQDESRELAARQDVIAHRNLLDVAALDHALIDPFETPADENDAITARDRKSVV